MRAVLDPNVVISGLLSPAGAPAEVLRCFDRGEFELVVSPLVADGLTRALAYPKLRRHLAREEAENAIRWLTESATVVDDPAAPPAVRSADPDDDYLIALAAAEKTALVSGDRHLLSLSSEIPVFTSREFIGLLGAPEVR